MTFNYPNYPKHIVGKSNFKKIENVGFLEYRGFFVGRTTSIDAESFSINTVKDSFAEGKEVKASTVRNGISVNLISIYKKNDMKFFPIEYKDNPRFHLLFAWDSDGCLPQVGEYKYNNTQRYYGFKISQIQNFEISFAYTAKCITPTDKIRFKIEHCPTMCNFWHFNIFILGQDSSSKKWIKLECPNIISNRTFEKIAIAALPILAKKIVEPKVMRARKLNKKYYIG